MTKNVKRTMRGIDSKDFMMADLGQGPGKEHSVRS